MIQRSSRFYCHFPNLKSKLSINSIFGQIQLIDNMLFINIVGDANTKFYTLESSSELDEIWIDIERRTTLSRTDCYILHTGRIFNEKNVPPGSTITVVPKLLGGKGGFGSMLRAIGAQIEKTTNREACRDLSGRRLRDINEEKRLKAWIEKQATREEETVERKKKKLERLCAQPKHEFKDQSYERERSILTERVGDAVEEGFKAASASIEEDKPEEVKKSLKRKTLLDLDIDSDELDSSDSDTDDEGCSRNKKTKVDRESHDSGHSSDEINQPRGDENKKLELDSEVQRDESTRDSMDSLDTKSIASTSSSTSKIV